MLTAHTPLQIPELDLKPEPTGGMQISDDMQQTLALLTAFWRNQRVVLKATPSGSLFITSPQAKGVYHIVATSDSYTTYGLDIPCSEVLIMGHPDNVGKGWVRPHDIPGTNNAWPLAKGDVVGLTVTNLKMVGVRIELLNDRLILLYTE